MTDLVARISAIPDRIEQLRQVTTSLAESQEQTTELARLRRRLIQELHDEGLSFTKIAEAAGISRGRVSQLRSSGPAPEGTFLGKGNVRIIVPLQQTSPTSRAVVAMQNVAAAQRLAEFARSVNLEVQEERVPTGSEITLNKPGTIVLGGDNLSPTVAALLRQDPIIQFTTAEGHPVLRELPVHSNHAPSDDPSNRYDVAYIGRLALPNSRSGRGALILAGLGPTGPLGPVHYLMISLTELFNHVGTAPFSAVLRIDYDPDTREPHAVKPISPLYRHSEYATV
jgi:hypothetical protein